MDVGGGGGGLYPNTSVQIVATYRMPILTLQRLSTHNNDTVKIYLKLS